MSQYVVQIINKMALSTHFRRLCLYALMLPFSVAISPTWAVSEGQVAPATQIQSIKGDSVVDLQSYKGKVVLVDFWASWCPPCRQSLPLFNELRHQLVDRGFEVFAINLDEDVKEGLRLFNQLDVDYVSGADPEGAIAEKWQVEAMPSSFLVDKMGKVRMVHLGFKEKDMSHIKSEILKLLNE